VRLPGSKTPPLCRASGSEREPLGPGIRMLLPGVDKLVRVDLRVVTLTIPPQEVITRDDNVPAPFNAVVLFHVVDPVKSVMSVENHAVATSQIAQTTLRSVVGRADLGAGDDRPGVSHGPTRVDRAVRGNQ
jgi:regulator of protease activity HflC (stomatin/prohibitin superfamily)